MVSKLFESAAKIIQFVTTLVYVFISMLLLTAVFGYTYLSGYVMSFVLAGIMLGVGLLTIDYMFSPRVGVNGETLPSRVRSSAASSIKR